MLRPKSIQEAEQEACRDRTSFAVAINANGKIGIPDNRPVIMSMVDDEEKLRLALPEIRDMAQESAFVLLEAEVIP